MLISLSEVMNCREETVQMEVETELSVFEMNGVTYPIQKKTPVRLTLNSPAPKRVLIQANTELILSASCDRCLREVSLPFEITYEQEIDFSKSEKERAEELDETAYISGYDLDVDRLITEELFLAFPAKILCKEDCKGICNVCGADLNAGECGCDRGVPDPRMAAIRDIFNNFKEV